MLLGWAILMKRPTSFQVVNKMRIVDSEQTSQQEKFGMILLLSY